MAVSVFMDKTMMPDEKDLSAVLGKSYKYWKEIRTTLDKEYGKLVVEWKHYGQKSGWILKLFHKKRNLFFMNPQKNFFAVAFVFGDKAVAQVEKSSLPSDMIQELTNARKYAEGRGLRIEVKQRETITHVLKLARIKIEN